MKGGGRTELRWYEGCIPPTWEELGVNSGVTTNPMKKLWIIREYKKKQGGGWPFTCGVARIEKKGIDRKRVRGDLQEKHGRLSWENTRGV